MWGKIRARRNPFFGLVVLSGTAFCITAFAYGVMAVRDIRPGDPGGAVTRSGITLMHWLDRHGFVMMMVELGILAAATFLAMGTDGYWNRQE
jgi:hypothetical protein